MILFWECYININFLAGFFTNQLVFECINECVASDYQRIILAFAALEWLAINKTFKVNYGCIIFFNTTVLNGNHTAVLLTYFVDFCIDISRHNFYRFLLYFDSFVVTKSNFRFYGYCSCKYEIFTFFDFYNINFRTRYDFQATLFCCFFVSIRNCKVCCIFIKNFRSVKFLYHFTWCFTFTKALNADVFLVFVIRFYHCLFKCICIYGNGDFCHALF